MKDLKIVLLFFSFSIGSFLVYLSLNFFYFLVLIAVTSIVFVLGYISHVHWLFPLYVAAAFFFTFWGLRVVFLRRRLALNVDFMKFLVRPEQSDHTINEMHEMHQMHEMHKIGPGKTELPQNLKKLIKETKDHLKKSGSKCISAKLITALAAISIVEREPQIGEEQLRRWKKYSFGISLVEALALVILFLPFALISFLFTMGMASTVTLLIYVLGFIFTWFLHSGIVTPIAGLILQGKIQENRKNQNL